MAVLNVMEVEATKAPLTGSAHKLMDALNQGLRDTTILLATDSTGTTSGGTSITDNGLLKKWVEWLRTLYPQHTFSQVADYNSSSGNYQQTTTLQTGTADVSVRRTCRIFFASASGTQATQVFGNADVKEKTFGVDKLYGIPSADLIVFMHGLNYTNQYFQGQIETAMLSALDEIHRWHPWAGIWVVANNPTLSDNRADDSGLVGQRVALLKNADCIDLFSLFKKAGKPASWYHDDIHPGPDGTSAGLELLKHLSLGLTRMRVPFPPSRLVKVPSLLLNSKFDTFSAGEAQSWTRTNVTLTENTTVFETGTRALDMAPVANSASYIEQRISGPIMRQLSYQNIVFFAAFRNPVGNANNRAGMVQALYPGMAGGLNETRSQPIIQNELRGDNYVIRACYLSMPKITNYSTELILRVCASDGPGSLVTAVGTSVSVDRVGLFLGQLPYDII